MAARLLAVWTLVIACESVRLAVAAPVMATKLGRGDSLDDPGMPPAPAPAPKPPLPPRGPLPGPPPHHEDLGFAHFFVLVIFTVTFLFFGITALITCCGPETEGRPRLVNVSNRVMTAVSIFLLACIYVSNTEGFFSQVWHDNMVKGVYWCFFFQITLFVAWILWELPAALRGLQEDRDRQTGPAEVQQPLLPTE
ncbi:hypothetical protein EDD11_005026 [Mortierella claussenii]|nr:hypothetical protein EDD11_005026 [Mortierella claussenii]